MGALGRLQCHAMYTSKELVYTQVTHVFFCFSVLCINAIVSTQLMTTPWRNSWRSGLSATSPPVYTTPQTHSSSFPHGGPAVKISSTCLCGPVPSSSRALWCGSYTFYGLAAGVIPHAHPRTIALQRWSAKVSLRSAHTHARTIALRRWSAKVSPYSRPDYSAEKVVSQGQPILTPGL